MTTSRKVVLTFHGVGPVKRCYEVGEYPYCITESNFLNILDAVSDVPNVELTFDDGNISDLEIAADALIERKLTATFFVLAGRLNSPWFLGPNELNRLSEKGMGIGLHGMHHTPWRKLDIAKGEIAICESKKILEAAINKPVTEASCPFGEYDRSTFRFLKLSGITKVFTSDGGTVSNKSWIQGRTSVKCTDNASSVMEIISRSRNKVQYFNEFRKLVKRYR